MALDIGSKRIGIAVSDPLRITAQGLETYSRQSERKDMRYIAQLAAEHEVDRLVAGLPYNMDDSIGPQAESVMAFANKLARRTGLPLDYEDERLSTRAATETLLQADVSRQKRRRVVDKLAAVHILQQYLATHSHGSAAGRGGKDG